MKKQEGQITLDLAIVRILPLLVLTVDSMKMSKGVSPTVFSNDSCFLLKMLDMVKVSMRFIFLVVSD